MTKLTRDAILKASDIDQQEVDVPEWGGTVTIQGLTAKQRAKVLGAAVDRKSGSVDLEMLYLMLTVESVVDEEGKPVFTAGDIEALGKKSGAALDRIVKVALNLSGMGEEVEKNS